VKDLAEAIAAKFFEAKKELEFRRITYSKTTLRPSAWKDCAEKERREWVESAKRVLADEEITQALANRASGL